METFKVTNKEIRKIVLKEVRKFQLLTESFIPQPEDMELAEFFPLEKVWYGTEYEMMVDECGSYQYRNHPLWVWVNTYKKNNNRNDPYYHYYIPITVEKTPKIIGDLSNLLFKVDLNQINRIKTFISKNLKWFQRIANQKQRRNILDIIPCVRVDENRILLTEMSNYLKSQTGLPVNIWVDGDRKKQHFDRIKVQNNYGNQIQPHDFITLRFSDMGIEGESKLKPQDIEKVRTFVKVNMHFILLIQRGKLSFEDFGKVMIPLDQNGNPARTIERDNSEWKPKDGHIRYGMQLVVSNLGKYNYVNQNGELVSDTWFDSAGDFCMGANGAVAYTKIGDKWYIMNTEGDLQEYLG